MAYDPPEAAAKWSQLARLWYRNSMILPGRLELSTLGDILGMLSRARVSGTLRLTETQGPSSGREHDVVLLGGRPAAIHSDGPRLGELVVSLQQSLKSVVRMAVAQKRNGDSRLVGELLVDLERGSEPIVRQGMRAQTFSRLDTLFSLRAARMGFRASALGDTRLAALVRAAERAAPLPIEDYLHGRPRRRQNEARPQSERERDLAVLGLPGDATAGRIKQAFRSLVVLSHPDRAQNDFERQSRTSRLREVTAAYSRLSLS